MSKGKEYALREALTKMNRSPLRPEGLIMKNKSEKTRVASKW